MGMGKKTPILRIEEGLIQLVWEWPSGAHGAIEHLDGLGGLLGGGHGDEGEAAAPVGDLVVDYL